MRLHTILILLLLREAAADIVPPRAMHSFVATRNGAFLIGGLGNVTGTTDPMAFYLSYDNFDSNSAKAVLNSLPNEVSPRAAMSCLYRNSTEKIICPNGMFLGSKSDISSVLLLNIDILTWATFDTVPPMQPKSRQGNVLLQNQIYSFGGNVLSSDVTSIDVDTLRLANVSTGPSPRDSFCMIDISDSEFLVAGGMFNSTILSDAWIFNIKTSQWSQLSISFPALAAMTCSKRGQVVYFFGGLVNPTTATANLWILDINTLNITLIEPVGDFSPKPVFYSSSITAGRYFIAAGGFSSTGNLTEMTFKFFDTCSNSWIHPVVKMNQVEACLIQSASLETNPVNNAAIIGGIFGSLILFLLIYVLYSRKKPEKQPLPVSPTVDVFTVQHPFIPSRPDEIQLSKGDEIIIALVFEDGWCTGFNLSSKLVGSFPLNCLNKASFTSEFSEQATGPLERASTLNQLTQKLDQGLISAQDFELAQEWILKRNQLHQREITSKYSIY